MAKTAVTILLTITCLQLLIAQNDFIDYSSIVDNGKQLQGILFRDVKKIKYKGEITGIIFDQKMSGVCYKLYVNIRVQTKCTFISAEYDNAVAEYEIFVFQDHHELPPTKKINYGQGSYVSHSGSDQNEDSSYYIFRFDDRLVKLTYKGLRKGKGWGAGIQALSKLIRFQYHGTRIKP